MMIFLIYDRFPEGTYLTYSVYSVSITWLDAANLFLQRKHNQTKGDILSFKWEQWKWGPQGSRNVNTGHPAETPAFLFIETFLLFCWPPFLFLFLFLSLFNHYPLFQVSHLLYFFLHWSYTHQRICLLSFKCLSYLMSFS